VRTAISVELRDGRLCVFLPPVRRLEDYLELIAAAEQARQDLGLPIHVEGYAPPYDPRLNVIRVAPDPGVIEVNVHPACELGGVRSRPPPAVYEEARQCRLGADKFMIDGRHTGTGGGNHVVVGGATPPDSPFLRRPDLLQSLVLHWQQHPSLRYLFSGLFIGPTSQAPRLDEARHDSLYELEIALAQVPATARAVRRPGWSTGCSATCSSTSPATPTAPRSASTSSIRPTVRPAGSASWSSAAFEMPPNARMNLAQQLLVRALIALLLAGAARQGRFARWGTTLHDRFMLPHYVWADFLDVLADLGDHGFDLDPEWFAAQLEFRFPFCGEVESRA
jgi:uncharacterized protein (DUF2126 family)